MLNGTGLCIIRIDPRQFAERMAGLNVYRKLASFIKVLMDFYKKPQFL